MKLTPCDVVAKVWRKVEELAEKRGMTRDEFIMWSDAENYRKNISEYEYKLIHAYQISKVVERLIINSKDKLAEYLKREKYWIRGYEKDFVNVDKAIKHLTEVCSHLKEKYNIEYEAERLLSYDDTLYEEILEKKKKRGRFKRDD